MKALAILVMFVIFLAPSLSFAQQSPYEIIIEPIPDSTNLEITVKGDIDSERVNPGKLLLNVRGEFGPDSKDYRGTNATITNDNPTVVFELDYPFQSNEVYGVWAFYGPFGKSIMWIPILSTPKVSTDTTEELPLALGQMQSTNLLVSQESGKLFESLMNENNLLSLEIQKKDAVMMEQVMVIQDLATKISKVKFTNTVKIFSLMAGQAELTSSHESFDGYLETLTEENKILSQEIEKKDAIIFEQLKVIQELAEKLSKVSFESTSSNFSLV